MYTELSKKILSQLLSQATYKHTDTKEKPYLQRILGIPHDGRVGFASRNAVQVDEEDQNTQKVFRKHDEVVSSIAGCRSQFIS